MKFKSNIEIQAGLEDAGGSPGTVNQLLSSTVTGTAWIDPSTIVAEAATLVVIACKNTSGAVITKGTPVYQTGTVGATATIEIAPADALISANKLPAIGLLQTALNNNGFGFVVISGALTNFTTSPIDGVVPVTGDKVFVKPGGGLTLTKPTGEGNGIQNMGLVGKVAIGSAGSITVSSILRTNDVPNLPEGRIWIGDGNTIVSDTVYVDEPNSRVGIGTNIPSELLHLSSTGPARILIEADTDNITETDNAQIILKQDGGAVVGNLGYKTGTNGLEITNNYAGADGILTFGTRGTERMRVSDLGNVGIGTTSPDGKLTIGSGLSTDNSTMFNVNGQHNDVGFNGGTSGLLSQGVWSFINSATWGQTRFYVQDQNNVASRLTFDFKGNAGNTNILAGTSTGNVGIGTTSPQSRLQVNGGVQLASDTASPSLAKVGTFRYYKSGNNTYVDMCMQTGASTYAWVNIVTNSW